MSPQANGSSSSRSRTNDDDAAEQQRPLAVDICMLGPVLSFFTLQELCQLALVCKSFRVPLLREFKQSLRRWGVTPSSKRIDYWAHRARVRDLFASAVSMETEYLNCFSSPATKTRPGLAGLDATGTSGAILRDVTRTFAHLEEMVNYDSLANVLLATSVYCPSVQYCQGMNYVAAVLLMESRHERTVLRREALAFAVLCGLIVNLNLGKMWSPGVPQLKLRIFQFDKILAEHLPALHAHFKRIELASDFFVSQWFLTLMSVNFINGECDAIGPLCMVWDVLFTEGWKAVFRVGLHALELRAAWLLEQNLEQTCRFLKRGLLANLQVVEWHKLSRITNKRLSELEREYESHVLLRSSSMVRQLIVLNDDSPVLRSDIVVLRERIERTERALRASMTRAQQFSRLCAESKRDLLAMAEASAEERAQEEARLAKLCAGAAQAKVEVEEHLERKRVFSEQLRLVVERNELSRASRLRNLFEEMNL